MTHTTITFTPEKLAKLKRNYAKCIGDTFFFEGKPILKAYAKYMIEYLEQKFNHRRKAQ